MNYRLIDDLQKKAIPVAQSCRVLGVSRAGFYEARRRFAKPVFSKALVYVRATFMASHQSYGSRRIVAALGSQGLDYGRYKVRALMQQAGLKPVWRRKFVHTTDSKHDLPGAENHLARRFNPSAPNVAYANHDEAKMDVANYIAAFYNCERLHSTLGNLSPSVFERNMAAKKPIPVYGIT
ncbi:MAG: integrase core domain protein [Herminiimonas sp.]|nr:integrase core domain protein [Herminiimonas sp.]